MAKVRLQFDLTEAQVAALDRSIEECETGNRKSHLQQMFALWEWAVEESRRGRKIGSFKPDKTDVEAVIIPPLERMRR